MRLQRNITEDGLCKYALIRLDKMREDGIDINSFINTIGNFAKYIEIAGMNSVEECFVIKLKDVNASAAITAYAAAASVNGDPELAEDVLGLLDRSSKNSPFCKKPD